MQRTFLRLRELLINKIFSEVKSKEGAVPMHGSFVELKFYSPRYDTDVFGKVWAEKLIVDGDDVYFVYTMPEYSEGTEYYMTEEESEKMCKTSLHELSADELYNIICEAGL